MTLRFDIYGRFQVEVSREGGGWAIYRLAPGKRVRAHDLVIPPEIAADELVTYLDDLFHEAAVPGSVVSLLADTA